MNASYRPWTLAVSCLAALLVATTASTGGKTAAGKPAEGLMEPFLGKARFEVQQIAKGERFPNVVVAVDGTVVAAWGSKAVRARRSEDGGKTWGDEIVIADPGFHGGGVTVDEKTGNIFAFVHDKHPPGGGATAPLVIHRSTDHGKNWQATKAIVHKDVRGYVPAMHMSETGITLRHGEHAGRLLRPARVFGSQGGYNTAIFSDDGGVNWFPSEPFPENGTGEGTVAELSNGRIYYNSRLHDPRAEKPTKRREAWSHDGGKTWKDWRIINVLPDGPQESAYGCMGGLIRLPVRGRDVLLFSNLDTPGGKRERLTVWASFDGGKTWPIKRLVNEGAAAYSSLAAGRPGTPSEGWIYVLFEAGGARLARFNLTWLLEGQATGDGKAPAF